MSEWQRQGKTLLGDRVNAYLIETSTEPSPDNRKFGLLGGQGELQTTMNRSKLWMETVLRELDPLFNELMNSHHLGAGPKIGETVWEASHFVGTKMQGAG